MQFLLQAKNAHEVPSYQPARRERSRPVFIGSGWWDEVVDLTRQFVGDHMLAIVVDDEVERLYPERLRAVYDALPRVRTMHLRGGEEAKQFSVAQEIHEFLMQNELQKDDLLMTVGGGTIGDVTGFVASTYMRGLQWIFVPTTLVMQADCAVGGKTAVNLGTYKDYCGTFYWPNVVFVDTSFLKTLPDKHFRNAIPEIAKGAMIGSEELFRKLCARVANGGGLAGARSSVEEFVQPALAILTNVIKLDPFQQDLRIVLQMGHTTAYALESASKLHLHHGEAVGIGLAFESYLAVQQGLMSAQDRKALIDLFENCGLSAALPSELQDRLLVDSMRHEKRNRGRAVQMVLPCTPGRGVEDWPAPMVSFTPDEIWHALAAYRQECA